MATRGIEPHKGALDTIGGFVDEGESLEEAMHRELEEELGVTTGIKLYYLGSGHDIYPYKNEDIPILNVFFWARVYNDFLFTVSDDVASALFMPLSDIPFERIGQDSIRFSLQLLKRELAIDS